jgi:hypothetical protein
MSFSASTCLTNTGTTTLSSTLTIYSNPISPTSPGTYVTTVPTTDITGGNCPYTFEVPDGTTIIRLSDPISGCYCDIPVSDNNMCTTCDLNFNTFTSPSVGNIVAGDITGTCDASVSNYLIYWYDVTDPLTPIFKFSSGKGSMFTPYDNIHPLTGTSSVLATSGTYDAILEKIELNGVVFSRTGGTGTVLADLDCLPSIINGDPFVISALNCSNGGDSSNLPQYEHRFAYSATTGGNLPTPLSTTFELSAGTKYFPWKFQGNSVPDKIKLTLVANAYGDVPIIVDYWDVGDLPSNNSTPTIFPKSADTTSFFSKITVLSAFTISNGDNILIEVTPSTANTQTSWTFYCGCLDEINCFDCTPSTGMTSGGTISYQFPISATTFTAYTGSCNAITIQYKVYQDCSYSNWTASTEYQYMNGNGIEPNNLVNKSGTLYVNSVSCGVASSPTSSQSCLNYGAPTDITYEKIPGLFTITSNNSTVISDHYNRYITALVPYISTFSGDNTNVGYYRHFYVEWPTSTGITPCGDGTTSKTLRIHQSSIVSTGMTGSDYYISFTLPTVTNGITFTSCDLNCNNNVNQMVVNINTSSTGSTENYTGTTNVGSSYQYVFYNVFYLTSGSTSSDTLTVGSLLTLENTHNNTYPASGETPTLIPSLSGVTCPNILNNMSISSPIRYIKYTSYYTCKLINPTNPLSTDINIFSNYIPMNGNPNPTIQTLIAQYIGGVLNIIDSDYFV